MGIIAILVGLIAITFIPVILIGWIMKGWRPYLMSALILAIVIAFSSRIAFHPIASFIHYFVVVAMYVIGGKLRTGKSENELLSGSTEEKV